MNRRPAAFIDRDGVLNVDLGYVGRIEDFHWLPGAMAAMGRLQQAGHALVVVTNQSGIARGLYTLQDFDRVTAHMRADLLAHGVTLDGVYACPHLPDAVVAAYRRDCNCRKPRPGMILQAIADLDLAPEHSSMFGDKASDIAAARAAGLGHCWLIGEAAALAGSDADAAFASLSLAVDSLLAGAQQLSASR